MSHSNKCYINRCPIINHYISMNILCGTVWLQWVIESAACIMETGEITREATDSLLRCRIAHTDGWRPFWTVISVAKLKIDMYGCNLVKTDVFLPFCDITMYTSCVSNTTKYHLSVVVLSDNFFWCHIYSGVILKGFFVCVYVNLT
jgi:hypothetical protein